MGERIRSLRVERKLRQEDVAAFIGTDAGSLSRIEHGKREPSLRQLRRLAEKFGVSPSTLLCA